MSDTAEAFNKVGQAAYEATQSHCVSSMENLAHLQAKNIRQLKEHNDEMQQQRYASNQASWWQALNRFVQPVFIALGAVAAVTAAAAGATALAGALAVCVVWRIGYETATILDPKASMLDGVLPKSKHPRARQVIEVAGVVFDVVAQVTLALATGHTILQIPAPMRGPIELATKAAAGLQAGFKGMATGRRAQAQLHQSRAQEKQALQDLTEYQIQDQSTEVQALIRMLERLTKLIANSLEQDHLAKKEIIR